MQEGRWTTVTESQFEHERQGLQAIRELLPDAGPWRAWSNFTFTAQTGHVREVDLLVLSPSGLHMIELKHWQGKLFSEDGTWKRVPSRNRVVLEPNPLHLVNQKAKELAGLLRKDLRGRPRIWIDESVCLTNDTLDVQLAPQDQPRVYGVNGLVEMLGLPPRDGSRRVDMTAAKEIAASLGRVGIRRSELERHVGPYKLDRAPLESGPTWVDYRAEHTDLGGTARIRIYLSERRADAGARESVENAARREAAVLDKFTHPGVVRYRTHLHDAHSAGPALVFDYHPETLRLDEYLLEHGEKLDLLCRIDLLRQLAETVNAAHTKQVYHRALAARSVQVVPQQQPKENAAESEKRWLSPQLLISDWQIAAKRSTEGGRGLSRHAHSALSEQHVAEESDPYLAPELTATKPDPVLLDVYGLGVLAYLLVTNEPPAASQAELHARLEADEGLRPSSLVDDLPYEVDTLVQLATSYRPHQRPATAAEFLELLEEVEEVLTAPEPKPTEPAKDPLEAVQADVLDGRWEVIRRLGTGSTSRAFLVRDRAPAHERRRELVVLKVALNERKDEILRREAEVLRQLRPDSGIIRLAEPDVLTLGGRTVLALEYVGDERQESEEETSAGRRIRREDTVGRQLREHGRLPMDQLEAYGDYLFNAVDFLEGEGIWHRDLKPDNIAIRIRPNRTRQLVLIDFSLARCPATHHEAGTEGYLDPFIGTLTRTAYDSHAERYALAVTLHQMASRELPRWGDGSVTPRQTDPQEFPYPILAEDAFERTLHVGLTAFFQKALHRDAAQRFPGLKPMRDAWRRIFLDATKAPPSVRSATPDTGDEEGTPGIAEAEPLSAEEQREQLAAQVARDTHLHKAGLSPAAEHFLYSLELTEVGHFLDYSSRKLVNAPGLGAKTRSELQRRQRQWGKLLRKSPAPPLAKQNRAASREELKVLEEGQATAGAGGQQRHLRRASLDSLIHLLVPQHTGKNQNAIRTVELLLGIPDEEGRAPEIGVWPTQQRVGEELELTGQRIGQLLKEQRERWLRSATLRELRDELVDLLLDLGRVAPVTELANALSVRRPCESSDPTQRRALALAAIRAVVELEQLSREPELHHQLNRKATDEAVELGLLALDVREGVDGVDTPAAPALLSYAARLGTAADRLAHLDALPTAGTVLARLSAIGPPPGRLDWDDRRLVELAAAASHKAAATPRLEIYPRELPLVRALRLTQAGLVEFIPGLDDDLQPGLSEDQVHKRVRSRFPELVVADSRGAATRNLPTGSRLTKALREAGFDLTLSPHRTTKKLRYLPTHIENASSFLSTGRARRTHTAAHPRFDDDTQVAAAARATDRIEVSSHSDGFRVLTARFGLAHRAEGELAGERGGAEPISVTECFLDSMRSLITPGTKPTWETLLKADAAEHGSRAAAKFAEYTRTAWGLVEPRLDELLDGGPALGPLLLTEATAFARYDAMGVLNSLAERARQGSRGLWLLVPQRDPGREPHLGHVAVPYQAGLGEWIVLPDQWVQQHGDDAPAHTPTQPEGTPT